MGVEWQALRVRVTVVYTTMNGFNVFLHTFALIEPQTGGANQVSNTWEPVSRESRGPGVRRQTSSHFQMVSVNHAVFQIFMDVYGDAGMIN